MIIHPTAIVHPHATLAADVQVGPYCIIGEQVTIGAGSVLENNVNIQGMTTIGVNNYFYGPASIGCIPQDKKYQAESTRLIIGDNNTFREYMTISIGTQDGGGITHIGSHNWFMTMVHIAHDCQVGNHTIFANGATLAGHVTVGDWAIISAFCAVHQFVVIGEHTLISANTGVSQDIPPYIVAQGYRAEPHGVNVEGLRRRGFTKDAIKEIKDAYKLLYRQGLSLEEAKAHIAERALAVPELMLFNQFFATASRGIIR